MSEIEDTADIYVIRSTIHVDLGILNLELDVLKSCREGEDMLEEQLGAISASTSDTLSMFSAHTKHLFATWHLLH